MDLSGNRRKPFGLAKKAMRLDPRNRDSYLWLVGYSYTQMGRYEKTIPILKQPLASNPNCPPCHLNLIVDYSELGREDEARAEGGTAD
jgi:tetratricopeptide (TPR) repeat protein